MIDEVIGTESFGFGEFFIGTSGSNDASPEEFRDLDRGAAYTAARAQNENVFAGLQCGPSHEHVPGSLENEWNRRGFLPFEIFGIREAIHFGSADKFGAAAINHVAKVSGLAAIIVEAREARG